MSAGGGWWGGQADPERLSSLRPVAGVSGPRSPNTEPQTKHRFPECGACRTGTPPRPKTVKFGFPSGVRCVTREGAPRDLV